MKTGDLHYTLYLDDSGSVVNTPVSVGALRVLGGILLDGESSQHEFLREGIAAAFEGILCDWHATELSRLRLDRGDTPPWLRVSLSDSGTTEAQFRRGVGATYEATRLRLRGEVQRRVGFEIARRLGRSGAALICLEHDTVGVSGRRDAMLDAAVEHAAWLVGGPHGEVPAALDVVVEANGAEATGTAVAFERASAVIASADAVLRARGSRGVRAGRCALVPARGISGKKKDGPPGLVLADFVANAFGPGGREKTPYSEAEARGLNVRRLRNIGRSRLAFEEATRVRACGAGPTAERLAATIRREKPAPIDVSLRLRSDVEASWEHAQPSVWSIA